MNIERTQISDGRWDQNQFSIEASADQAGFSINLCADLDHIALNRTEAMRLRDALNTFLNSSYQQAQAPAQAGSVIYLVLCGDDKDPVITNSREEAEDMVKDEYTAEGFEINLAALASGCAWPESTFWVCDGELSDNLKDK